MNAPAPEAKVALFLDDNEMTLKLGRALLEEEGWRVVTTATWGEFSHAITVGAPSIVFVDVNLPSIQGDRLVSILKNTPGKKNIPMILISDLPLAAIESKAKAVGADGSIQKPLTRARVLELIKRLVPNG